MSHCQTFMDVLRKHGYRITPQREMIIEAIAHDGNHMTAEELFERVQQRSHAVNIATIYRTLDLLVEEGLASRIVLADGRVVYATHLHGPHIHLVCRHCNAILSVDAQVIGSLSEELYSKHGFTADLSHISVFGVCATCQERLSD